MIKYIFPVIILSLLIASPVSADLVPCDLTGPNRCTLCNFFDMVHGIFSFVFDDVVPIVAVLMVVIGGIYFITSVGRPEKLQEAKKLFTSVFIGLLIIYGAWVIVNLFLTTLGVTAWKDGNWNIISCDISSSGTSGSPSPATTPPPAPGPPPAPSSFPLSSADSSTEITSINASVVSGDELSVKVGFKNNSAVTRNYVINLLNSEGNFVKNETREVNPGVTATVDSNWVAHDIDSIGDTYTIEVSFAGANSSQVATYTGTTP